MFSHSNITNTLIFKEGQKSNLSPLLLLFTCKLPEMKSELKDQGS